MTTRQGRLLKLSETLPGSQKTTELGPSDRKVQRFVKLEPLAPVGRPCMPKQKDISRSEFTAVNLATILSCW